MLHGYCIRRAGEAPPPGTLTGLDGASVQLLQTGELGLWFSEGGGARPNVERLRQHERVVRLALRSSTPLPLRFGSSFRNAADAEGILNERAAEFLTTLEQLENRVEMGLRIEAREAPESGGAGTSEAAADDAAAPEASSGRAYLEARRRALQVSAAAREAAEQKVGEVEAAFSDMQLPSVRTSGDGAALLGGVAHLVHRRQLRPYHERAARLQSERPDLRITLTGPWAPYSFV